MSYSLLAVIALAGALASPASFAATDSVPKFDIERGCRLELSDGSPFGETMASCRAAEQRARDNLAPRWNVFSRADKTLCINATETDGSPSYVELETCLDMTPSGQITQ